jgi:hypothetical protein
VHTNKYLKAGVKGEHTLLLQSIAVTFANYNEALNLLNERYHDKRELVNATRKQLFVLQSLKRQSATAMRRFIHRFGECVRCLTTVTTCVVPDTTPSFSFSVEL